MRLFSPTHLVCDKSTGTAPAARTTTIDSGSCLKSLSFSTLGTTERLSYRACSLANVYNGKVVKENCFQSMLFVTWEPTSWTGCLSRAINHWAGSRGDSLTSPTRSDASGHGMNPCAGLRGDLMKGRCESIKSIKEIMLK